MSLKPDARPIAFADRYRARRRMGRVGWPLRLAVGRGLKPVWGLPLMLALVAGCNDPATVTPGATSGEPGAIPGRSSVVEMTMPAPPTREAVPVALDRLEAYVDAGGLFSVQIPAGWLEQRQDPSTGGSDVRVGTLFQAPDGDGLLSITQFDNGREPSSLGTTVNTVLRDVTGWMDQPGYRELDRESVVERPGEAMRVEIVYDRSNGVPMHSLALFQIDGTTFSMVNLSVAEGSFLANESVLREVLRSYRVPAAAAVEPPALEENAGEGEAGAAGEASPTGAVETGDGESGATGEADAGAQDNVVPEAGANPTSTAEVGADAP